MPAGRPKGSKDSYKRQVGHLKGHYDQLRTRIKTEKLIARLQAYIFDGVKMDRTQVKAAEILLDRVLPKMAAVTISGDKDKPLQVDHITLFARLEQARHAASATVLLPDATAEPVVEAEFTEVSEKPE